MILEPVMMNAGIILPADGYLAAIPRPGARRGALLIFDEVKTGFTTARAGSSGCPVWCPTSSVWQRLWGRHRGGGRHRRQTAVMELIADGRYEQVGTFNGNPLALAATRDPLGQILTPAAYERMELAGARLGQFGRDDRRTRLRLAW